MGEKNQVTAVTGESAAEKRLSPGIPLQILNGRVTYRNAPIHVLEKFTFKDVDAAHRCFLQSGFDECVILQTCNRVEVYAASSEPDSEKLVREWSLCAGISASDFQSVEIEGGDDAVKHLMKLAAGLDSLVIGEDQILGQVRRAFEFSKSSRYAGSALSVIFDRALKVGSRVRTATGVNRGSVSIASVSVALAEEYFDDLKDKKVMLIGTGEAASLVAKVLKRKGVAFSVTSRVPDRAKSFASKVAGSPVPFEDALEMLRNVDIVFTATKAPYRLITYERIENAMEGRQRGMMIFDLSNPRTVDEKVTSIHGVKLVNMDQIAEMVGKNMKSRIREVRSAEKLIENEMRSVDTKMRRMKGEPVVVSVFKTVDTIRERELKKALLMLGKEFGSDEARIVEQLSYAIVEGILAAPMNNLRKEIEAGKSEELIKIVAKLFRYEDRQTEQSR
jgi:glutamyl-tRNA reductase